MIEAHTQNQTLPTLPERLQMVRESALASIQVGDTDAFHEALADVFTSKPFESAAPELALVDFLAYAGAAFAAGNLYHSRGDADAAGLYQAIGQDLLAMALEMIGMCMAAGVSCGGISVH